MKPNFNEAVDIKGYEGQYKILPDGRVWSVRRVVPATWQGPHNRGVADTQAGGKFLKPILTAAGPVISLSSPRKTVLIYRLVAKAHVPGNFVGAFVGFKDGNRSNYHATNLEWITRAESQLRAKDRPKKKVNAPPPRRASGALDVWDTIPTDPAYTYSAPLPWET
jgi:hypothetical protein